jgi:signal transduction histidine kinase
MRHRQHWRHSAYGPPRAVLRIGCMFVALLALAAIGATTVVTMFFRGPSHRTPLTLAGLVMLIGLIAGSRHAFRRVATVFREQQLLRRQLMADVAHELRTPLAILQGRVEGLIDGVYPRDDAHLEELLGETRHLSRLVEDLRTIANAEAGALDLRKERVDIAELLRDAAASFGAAADVPELPSIEVDPVRIREVLLNLLSNAARAGGSVSVRAVAEARRIVITVTDTGSGIPAEELPYIFTRFRKGRDSRGSGLGLAIARNLVLAHDGGIDVESAVGKGTSVRVWLPR